MRNPELLAELAELHGTDKRAEVHDYVRTYDRHLGPLRHRVRTVLELGVHAGASLRVWRDWMPRAEVHGLDLRKLPSVRGERLHLWRGDQCDASCWPRWWPPVVARSIWWWTTAPTPARPSWRVRDPVAARLARWCVRGGGHLLQLLAGVRRAYRPARSAITRLQLVHDAPAWPPSWAPAPPRAQRAAAQRGSCAGPGPAAWAGHHRGRGDLREQHGAGAQAWPPTWSC